LFIGNAKLQLNVPATVYAGEPTNISCTGSVRSFHHTKPLIEPHIEGGCSKDRVYEIKEIKSYFQRMFTITCKNGNHTIKCMANVRHSFPVVKTQLQGEQYLNYTDSIQVHVVTYTH